MKTVLNILVWPMRLLTATPELELLRKRLLDIVRRGCTSAVWERRQVLHIAYLVTFLQKTIAKLFRINIVVISC